MLDMALRTVSRYSAGPRRRRVVGSLHRRFSYTALAGSLLLNAASLRLFIGPTHGSIFASALLGNVVPDGPLPGESVTQVWLGAWQKIVARSARGGETNGL